MVKFSKINKRMADGTIKTYFYQQNKYYHNNSLGYKAKRKNSKEFIDEVFKFKNNGLNKAQISRKIGTNPHRIAKILRHFRPTFLNFI